MKKLQKLSFGISIAIIFALMLSVLPLTVSAANEFDIGNFTYSMADNPTLKGWCTNGRDGIATSLELETLKAAKHLRIELSAPITGSLVFIFQSEANWWDQKDGVKANGTTLIVDLTSMSSWADFVATATQGNFLIGDWGTDYWADISIVSAILSDEPAPEVEAEPVAEYVAEDLVIGEGVSVIRAIQFDGDAYLELGTDGNYDARPEMKEAGGPQTESDNVGWIAAGEWLQYTVNVSKGGEYLLKARAGSGGDGGNIEFYCEDELVSTVNVPNTGGWGNYVIYDGGKIVLTEGVHTIKVAFPDGNLNFSAMAFVEPTATKPYADHSVYGGTNTIKAAEYDNDGFVENTLARATDNNQTWYFDAWTAGSLYIARPEFEADHSGPQQEAATVPGLGDVGALCYTGGEEMDGDTVKYEAEYVSYTINVLKAGKYALSVWAMSGSDNKYMDFYLDGELASASPVIPNTGWGSPYNLYDVAVLDLTVGTHVLKVVWPGGDINVAAYVLNEGEVYAVAPAPVVEEVAETPAPAAEVAEVVEAADAGEAAVVEAVKENPKSGDSLLFPVILVILVGAAFVTIRKIRAR